VQSSDATRQMMAAKQIILGEGEEQMKFDVNPEEVIDLVTSDGKFWSVFSRPINDDSGKQIGEAMDLDRLYKAIAYAKNPVAFEKALIDYGKSLGIKQETDEINAIPKGTAGTPSGQGETLEEAFRKRGVDRTL